ncbi:hypothetical protein HK096_009810 [Nowakowskiella sp. JEL0078]|nr:hypothetical protein HK096_009810 [Nowakowskiella sp. JEL0078]
MSIPATKETSPQQRLLLSPGVGYEQMALSKIMPMPQFPLPAPPGFAAMLQHMPPTYRDFYLKPVNPQGSKPIEPPENIFNYMTFNFSSVPNSQTEDQIQLNVKSPELFGQHSISLLVSTSNSESKVNKCKEKSEKVKKQPSENLSSNACANWTTPMFESLLKSCLDT